MVNITDPKTLPHDGNDHPNSDDKDDKEDDDSNDHLMKMTIRMYKSSCVVLPLTCKTYAIAAWLNTRL